MQLFNHHPPFLRRQGMVNWDIRRGSRNFSKWGWSIFQNGVWRRKQLKRTLYTYIYLNNSIEYRYRVEYGFWKWDVDQSGKKYLYTLPESFWKRKENKSPNLKILFCKGMGFYLNTLFLQPNFFIYYNISLPPYIFYSRNTTKHR